MDFTESAEHRDLRAAVAAIASGFGPQYYAQHAAERTPCEELWTKLGEAGFIGVNIPAEYGGGGGGLTELALVCEELGAQGNFAAAARGLGSHLGGGFHHPVRHAGAARDVAARPGRRRPARWCSRSPSRICGIEHAPAAHRPPPGRGRWVLRGTKYYISGVDEADALLVVARTGGAEESAGIFGAQRGPVVAVPGPRGLTRAGTLGAPGRSAAAGEAVHAAFRRRTARPGGAGRPGGRGVPAGLPRAQPGADHRGRAVRGDRPLRAGRRRPVRPRARGVDAPIGTHQGGWPTRWPGRRSTPSWPR